MILGSAGSKEGVLLRHFTIFFLFISSLQMQAQDVLDRIELDISSGPVFYSNSVGLSLEVEGIAYYQPVPFLEILQPSTGVSLLFAGTESDIHTESVFHLCANPGFTIELMKLPADNPFFLSLNEKNNEITLDLRIDCGFGIGYIRSELNNGVDLHMMSLLIAPAIKASLDFGSLSLHGTLEYLVENIDGSEKRGIRFPLGISIQL